MVWQYAATVAIVCFILGMVSQEYKAVGFDPKNLWDFISDWTAVLFLISLPVAAIAFVWGR